MMGPYIFIACLYLISSTMPCATLYYYYYTGKWHNSTRMYVFMCMWAASHHIIFWYVYCVAAKDENRYSVSNCNIRNWLVGCKICYRYMYSYMYGWYKCAAIVNGMQKPIASLEWRKTTGKQQRQQQQQPPRRRLRAREKTKKKDIVTTRKDDKLIRVDDFTYNNNNNDGGGDGGTAHTSHLWTIQIIKQDKNAPIHSIRTISTLSSSGFFLFLSFYFSASIFFNATTVCTLHASYMSFLTLVFFFLHSFHLTIRIAIVIRRNFNSQLNFSHWMLFDMTFAIQQITLPTLNLERARDLASKATK